MVRVRNRTDSEENVHDPHVDLQYCWLIRSLRHKLRVTGVLVPTQRPGAVHTTCDYIIPIPHLLAVPARTPTVLATFVRATLIWTPDTNRKACPLIAKTNTTPISMVLATNNEISILHSPASVKTTLLPPLNIRPCSDYHLTLDFPDDKLQASMVHPLVHLLVPLRLKWARP
jgi:hypothetical protein